MKNEYTLLLLFAAFCCMGVQCKEEEPDKIDELAKLPPATTKGRNTFGCLINGKAFPYGAPGEHIKLAYYDNGEFYVSYFTRLNPSNPSIHQGINLHTNKIRSEGKYCISYKNFSEDFFTVITTDENFFSADKSNLDGCANITISKFDTINQIISGNFRFTLNNENGNKKVIVEHGRFDFQY